MRDTWAPPADQPQAFRADFYKITDDEDPYMKEFEGFLPGVRRFLEANM